MKKKVLITVGGTGGHVFPALALAKQITTEFPSIELCFAGGSLSRNRYFEKDQYSFVDLPCGPLSFKSPIKLMKSLWKHSKGVWQSSKFLRQFQPDLVIGFGSYYTLPVLISAWMHKFPIFLHEANSVPGKVNRLFSKTAVATGIHFPGAAAYLKGKTVVTNLPLRCSMKKDFCSKERARAYFDLDEKKQTLLIFGGSQGALSMNLRIMHALKHLLAEKSLANWQVLHFIGRGGQLEQIQANYAHLGVDALVKEFESSMEYAWQAADVFIGRAGANTIAEAIEFEIPGLLIPFPFATDNHQEKNARFFTEIIGAGTCLLENKADEKTFNKAIREVLLNHEKREQEKKALTSYKVQSRVIPMNELLKKYF